MKYRILVIKSDKGFHPASLIGMKAVVFLERDGVLNNVETVGPSFRPPYRLEEMHIREEAIRCTQALKDAGFLLIATTNQPGVAQGKIFRGELDLMHTFLRKSLPLDDIFHCPHDEEDNCHCHKPEAAMFTEAAFKWHIDMDRSFVISDKWQDAAAAHVAGCTSVLIRSPWIGTGHHDFIVEDMDEAVEKILGLHVPCLSSHQTYELA